jgi:hypothetical protein
MSAAQSPASLRVSAKVLEPSQGDEPGRQARIEALLQRRAEEGHRGASLKGADYRRKDRKLG